MEEEEEADMTAEELAVLRLRAEAGDTQALFELGCELDGDESAVYLRRAAEGGHAQAMVCYAEHLRWSGNTPEQARAAIQWHPRRQRFMMLRHAIIWEKSTAMVCAA